MAILVRQSTCEIRRQTSYVFNNIPFLYGACLRTGSLIVYSTPTSNGSKGYIDFIYKDTGHINDGFDLGVEYLKCPMTCRNYRYSLLVKMIDDKF